MTRVQPLQNIFTDGVVLNAVADKQIVNPGLYSDHSGKIFAAALKKLGYTGGLKELMLCQGHYILAAHGTSTKEAVLGICREGFDPKKRHVQCFGKGEYFDTTGGTIAKTYGEKTGSVIVAIIVTKDKNGIPLPEITHNYYTTGKKIAVVDNPVNFMYSFCLPLAVLRITAKPLLENGKSPLLEMLGSVASGWLGGMISAPEAAAMAVAAVTGLSSIGTGLLSKVMVDELKKRFRETKQHFIDNYGVTRFTHVEAHELSDTEMAEAVKEVPCLQFMSGHCSDPQCPMSHNPKLVEIAQDQGFSYPRRPAAGAQPSRYKWQYLENGKFRDYSDAGSKFLELSRENGNSVVTVKTSLFEYCVDMEKCIQRNTSTNTTRKIRRVAVYE